MSSTFKVHHFWWLTTLFICRLIPITDSCSHLCIKSTSTVIFQEQRTCAPDDKTSFTSFPFSPRFHALQNPIPIPSILHSKPMLRKSLNPHDISKIDQIHLSSVKHALFILSHSHLAKTDTNCAKVLFYPFFKYTHMVSLRIYKYWGICTRLDITSIICVLPYFHIYCCMHIHISNRDVRSCGFRLCTIE